MDRNRIERREGVQEKKKMQIVSKYRVATRQLFTLEMIHEKVLWAQDLNPTSVDIESRKTFVTSEPGFCCCGSLPLDATIFESDYVKPCVGVFRIWRIESVTAVQLAFHTNFTQNQPAENPDRPVIRRSSGKGAFGKARVLVGLPCPMRLQTMFDLAAK